VAKLKKENLIEGWKIIVKYLRPHREAVFTLIGLSVVSAALNASIPYLAGKVIDDIIKFNPGIYQILVIWFLVRMVENIIDWQMDLRNAKLGSKLEGFYIVDSYQHLLKLPLSFHKTQRIGDVANRISRAAGWLHNLSDRIVIGLAPQFLSIIFALIFTLYTNVFLSLILIGGSAIYVLILLKIAPESARKSKIMHRAFNRAYGDAYDSVLNVQSVKQAVAEEYERKKLLSSFVNRAYKWWLDYIRTWSSLNVWQKMLVATTQFLIFAVSVVLIRENHLTVGQLIMFNGYAALFFGPFVYLGQNWQTIQNGVTAIEYAEKILNIPAEKYSPKNAAVLENITGGVEFQSIGFWYLKKQGEILKNISFGVLPGEKIALVGESGVGKSTLVDLISYYYKPSSGKILIDGHNIKNLDLKFLRSQIAVVPQEIMLFNDTVKNNIKYGSFGASDEEILRAASLAHADEFINNFPKKYEQVVGERGIKLSMGQKQRVALARAFLRNPKILILDEPTSALDAKSEKFIQESLSELMKGRTTFIIAHRLSTVREVDKIFVLHEGEIKESGTHDELINKKSGFYRRLYELQMGFD